MPLTSSNMFKKISVELPNDSKQGLGGGWTFRRNLEKALKGKVDFVETNADIALIAGATMISRDTFKRLKEQNTKIILRIDNVPRNSRNRNTGTSRLKDFAQGADAVVYQSEWSLEYLAPFLGRLGKVINNGVDSSIFNTNGRVIREDKNVYMYSRYSRDENKRWEEAWYKFQDIHKKDNSAKLLLVGRFSNEQVEYNFDFFNGEKVKYMGVVNDPRHMAEIYKQADYFLATYYNDCYSNTYCEAVACGVELYEPNLSGGTGELVDNGVISLEEMGNQYMQLFKELL